MQSILLWEALEQASHALSKHLYENAEGSEASPGPEQTAGAGGRF